jgi:ferredoxin
MRIITARRISQVFFFLLFLWLCLVMSIGDRWWQLRGWPVNWFFYLDPLAGVSTLLTTGTLYNKFWWSLITIALTLIFGRFFCGWVCPFGSIHHLAGYISHRKKSLKKKAELNRYSKWQTFKYYLLIVFMGACLLDTFSPLFKHNVLVRSALQIGLLDPISMVYRSVQLAMLPLLPSNTVEIFGTDAFYQGTWLIGFIFIVLVGLNFIRPRFFCRFLCPLGALFGVLNHCSLWRLGKTQSRCTDCLICEKNCEGACHPSNMFHQNECVLCMNCRADCHHGLIGYNRHRSASGEIALPQLSRRHFIASAISGLFFIPMVRIDGALAANWNYRLIRPPGALPETEFLARCLKCGQCMRICPTNVIQPALFEAGLEGLWSPVLNFKIGTSGCQLNCIACGHICPTAAIRPLSISEKRGEGPFSDTGPVRMGTAFVDRGRCLPWAMDLPCIVCQENCPVSPKAIFTRTVFQQIQGIGNLIVESFSDYTLTFGNTILKPGRYATGDYYCRIKGIDLPIKILENSENRMILLRRSQWDSSPTPGDSITIEVKLQRPFVDPSRCIGCGICEHECPVKGLRAIRITAENESRNREHRMLLKNNA